MRLPKSEITMNRVRHVVEETLERLAADRDVHPNRESGASMAAEAVRLAQSIGWAHGRARALLQLARYQDPPDSLQTNIAALRLFRRLHDGNGEAAALNNLALLFRAIGLFALAGQLGRQAYQVVDENAEGNARRAIVLATQAMIHADAGDLDLMLAVGSESLAIARASGSIGTETRVAESLATALHFGRLSTTARHFVDVALVSASRSNDLAVEHARAVKIAAEIHLDLADYTAARDTADEGSGELETVSLHVEVVIARLAFAQALSMLGAGADAIHAASSCLALASDDIAMRANVHLIVGELELNRGMTDQALASLTEAMRIAREIQDERLEGAAHFGLYRVSKGRNEMGEALYHLEAFHAAGIDHVHLELPLPFTEYSMHTIVAQRRRVEDAHRLALAD